MILNNARIITLDAKNRVIPNGAVTIGEDGRISAVADHPVPPGDDVVDLRGRLLMPALINCHTHLYSTLARGLSLSGKPPKNFSGILKKLWWRLDRALNVNDVYYSALTGLIESAKCGVGTLVDHHSSPNACAGSLDGIEQAFREVGLRGVLCYEVSDRNGAGDTNAGIRENIRYIERAAKQPESPIAAMFGLHAAFTLSDRTLRRCVEANESLRAGFHVHVAEDRADSGAVQRLADAGILDEHSIAAHCVHVTNSEVKTLARRSINVVHNPQSNCNNAVGVQRLLELSRHGVRVGLGSDGYTPRMWDEFKTAYHLQKLQARDPRVAYEEAFATAFVNNCEIVRKVSGFEIGRIEKDACADMAVFDYLPPTPLDGDNLFGHLLFGIANAPVEALIVNGRWVVRDRQVVNLDEREIAERASAEAQKLWRRFEDLS